METLLDVYVGAMEEWREKLGVSLHDEALKVVEELGLYRFRKEEWVTDLVPGIDIVVRGQFFYLMPHEAHDFECEMLKQESIERHFKATVEDAKEHFRSYRVEDMFGVEMHKVGHNASHDFWLGMRGEHLYYANAELKYDKDKGEEFMSYTFKKYDTFPGYLGHY